MSELQITNDVIDFEMFDMEPFQFWENIYLKFISPRPTCDCCNKSIDTMIDWISFKCKCKKYYHKQCIYTTYNILECSHCKESKQIYTFTRFLCKFIDSDRYYNIYEQTIKGKTTKDKLKFYKLWFNTYPIYTPPFLKFYDYQENHNPYSTIEYLEDKKNLCRIECFDPAFTMEEDGMTYNTEKIDYYGKKVFVDLPEFKKRLQEYSYDLIGDDFPYKKNVVLAGGAVHKCLESRINLENIPKYSNIDIFICDPDIKVLMKESKKIIKYFLDRHTKIISDSTSTTPSSTTSPTTTSPTTSPTSHTSLTTSIPTSIPTSNPILTTTNEANTTTDVMTNNSIYASTNLIELFDNLYANGENLSETLRDVKAPEINKIEIKNRSIYWVRKNANILRLYVPGYNRVVQIILFKNTIENIVSKFDFSHVQFVYDGNNILTTLSGLEYANYLVSVHNGYYDMHFPKRFHKAKQLQLCIALPMAESMTFNLPKDVNIDAWYPNYTDDIEIIKQQMKCFSNIRGHYVTENKPCRIFYGKIPVDFLHNEHNINADELLDFIEHETLISV